MRSTPIYVIAIIAGLAAASLAFLARASTEDSTPATRAPAQADAVFAGGCFWCVEADFDKVDGVLQTISGYTGGDIANPSYEQVSHSDTGHLEAVRVIYDPNIVSYEELVDYFWRTIDPLDDAGQFCDKGPSYRTAFFVETENERQIVEESKTELEESGWLSGPIATRIVGQSTFWPAEDYHQDYYTKNKRKYDFYRTRCGRDQRLEQVWSKAPELDLIH